MFLSVSQFLLVTLCRKKITRIFLEIYRVFAPLHIDQKHVKSCDSEGHTYKAELLSLWTFVASDGFGQCWMLAA